MKNCLRRRFIRLITVSRRFNRFLAAALHAYTEQYSHSDWNPFLQAIAFAYRISIVDSINSSPFFLLFGREPTPPTSIFYGTEDEFDVDVCKYALMHPKMMRLAFEKAADMQLKFDISKKIFYDRKEVVVNFKIGDPVLLFTPKVASGLSKKIPPKITGPFKIVKKNSLLNYQYRWYENR